MFLRYELKVQAGWVGSEEIPHHHDAARGGLLPLSAPRAVIIGMALVSVPGL